MGHPPPTAPPALREDADIETSTEGYAARFAGPVGEWFLDVQARTTAALLADLPPGARVLDVGGGHAQIAPVLAAAGFDTTVAGSDPVCAERLAPWLANGRLRFVSGDLLGLPFPDRAFDVVTCFRLLPHSIAVDRLVGELCRLASRCVVADYPARRSVNFVAEQLFTLKKRVEGNTRPFALFDRAEVRRLFAAHGFRVAAERPQFVFPMALHRVAKSASLTRLLEAPWGVVGVRRLIGSPIIIRADREGAGG